MPMADALHGLAHAATPEAQAAWRRAAGGDLALEDLLSVYLVNPFLRLSPQELARLRARPGDPMAALIAAREAAAGLKAPRYAVFGMPTSGSSFVQSSLQVALDLPFTSLTFFGPPRQGTYFGANGQEDELDELAILRAVLHHRAGFVAQHHTRGSLHLALQLRAWAIAPILTVRNIFDCIVSFDDMVQVKRRDLEHPWVPDAPFLLPRNYADLDAAARYELVGASLGPWLVNFAVSWRRSEAAGAVRPLRLHYDTDMLDPERLAGRLRAGLGLDATQSDRLLAYARRPDPARVRFNKGVAGRGRQLLPPSIIWRLEAYVRRFEDDLTGEDLRQLLH